MQRYLSNVHPWTYQLMRIGVGLLFAFHGAQKMLGLFGGTRMPLMSQMGLAGIIELVGGLLVAAGVAVTPVAFICAAEMVAAFVTAHLPRGIWPIQNGGELAALYFFTFLYIGSRGRK
jgi:putative oxidoreductase